MRFNFDMSKFSGLSEKLGLKNPRPPFESFYIYGLLLFLGFLLADVGTTYLRGNMLPSAGVSQSRKAKTRKSKKKKNASLFSGIKEKNIFNADHVIPPSLGEKQNGDNFEDDSKPVLSSLPLELVGTLVHTRGFMSVATIQIKGKKDILPYQV
ncbi:MAG: hypothetical protein MJK18_00500, partial [Bdellovibrionales bacterium]|nr:hypothetical protein [Bdellovibrionales bacterium]